MENVVWKENPTERHHNLKYILKDSGILIGLIGMGFVFTLLSNKFFTVNNLLTVALQTSVIGVLAIAETFAIVTSGIDLSVGSVLAVSGVVAGKLMVMGVPVPLAILAGLGVGAFCGLLTGLAVTKLEIAPFIATLGMMSIARGSAYIITGALPVSGLPKSFYIVGGGELFGIPVAFLIMLLMAVIFGFVLKKTKFGRYVYCLGSNEDAAKLSGINVNATKIGVYMISGLLAAVAGIILASRLVSAQATAGIGYEMDGIAAAIIGGCSPLGGTGKISETIIGAFVIGVLRNGLNLLSVSAFWQQVSIGCVIILAVALDTYRRKKTAKIIE